MEPTTLGEHLKKRRLDRGLLQREAAEEMGVSAEAVGTWERDEVVPALRSWPAVIDFLGFVPFGSGQSLPEQIHAWRRARGLTQPALAKRLRVDPSTLAGWERGEHVPIRRHRERLETILGSEAAGDVRPVRTRRRSGMPRRYTP